MTATTVNLVAQVQEPGSKVRVPAAAERLFEGTMCFANASGYASGTAGGAEFLGVVVRECNNTGNSAGDLDAEVYQNGVFYHFTTATMAQTHVGLKLYATDDQTITSASTSNSYVGTCAEFVSASKVGVRIDVQNAA
jgi:predicted RecA/RadA family phage recombinase